ncbi:MAG TPA: hypothetical protein VJ994_00945 [Paracoccaceae bacterium]|nr:hypothetical protein [Paracoccaceae bacterium]
MTRLLQEDGEAVHLGDLLVLNNTWGRRDLVSGVDYVQTAMVEATLSDGVRFEWVWPEVEPQRVLAYPELIAGRSPWREGPSHAALPVPLDAALDGLTAEIAAAREGEGFNVALDLWLTTDPEGGAGSITHEVMIWLSRGEARPAGTPVDEVAIGGVDWELRIKDAPHGGGWNYSALVARTETLEGAFDLGAMLGELDARAPFGDGLWLTTVEIGAEIVGGAGSWTATRFDVSAAAVEGGEGADVLIGGASGDFLRGRGGDDRLEGGAGPDRLDGGWGADVLIGGPGVDRLSGGPGDDVLRGHDGDDRVAGGVGADRLYGGGGVDRIEGGADGDSLHGGALGDRLEGDAGDDLLVGDLGSDALYGGSGDDGLYGGAGDDRLSGGSGTNRLSGAEGADVFVLSPDGLARIADFEPGTDRIDVARFGGGLEAIMWRETREGAALDVEGEVRAVLPGLTTAEAETADLVF